MKQHQQIEKMLQNQNTRASGKEREKRDVLEVLLSQRRTAFLPWTVKTAEVFWSPHTQVYSPVSSTSRSRISSSAAVSSCLILYFSLGLSALSPFFHSTGTPTLLSSQRRVAVAPSVASLFFNPSLKNAGKAEGQQYQQWDVELQRVKIMFKFPFPSYLELIYQHKNRDSQGSPWISSGKEMSQPGEDLMLAVICRGILHVLRVTNQYKQREKHHFFSLWNFNQKEKTPTWNFWKENGFLIWHFKPQREDVCCVSIYLSKRRDILHLKKNETVKFHFKCQFEMKLFISIHGGKTSIFTWTDIPFQRCQAQ